MPRLDKKLAGYTLIGAAAFTVTGIAHADDITYVPVGQTFIGLGSGSSYTLNLSGGASPDFTITADGVEVSASTSNGAGILNDGGEPAALIYGALIDPAAGGWGDGGKMSEVITGNWPNDGKSAYLGFYFVGTDGDHAGWMNISTSTLPPGAAFTINSYAFDTTPNEAITAGIDDPNPIPLPTPEPSSLSLLAMGSAGLLELRRRRQNHA